MAFVTLEDMYREIDAVLFPKTYQKYKDSIKESDIVLVFGKCNMRNGQISLIINDMKKLEDLDISGGANSSELSGSQSNSSSVGLDVKNGNSNSQISKRSKKCNVDCSIFCNKK